MCRDLVIFTNNVQSKRAVVLGDGTKIRADLEIDVELLPTAYGILKLIRCFHLTSTQQTQLVQPPLPMMTGLQR